MSLPVISVIVPTVDGREEHFDRCWNAYTDTQGDEYKLDLIVVRNEPTCGWGWQAGAERISDDAEYVHFTCDDIEPQPGWAAPAIGALKHHVLPAPRVLNGTTGAPEYFPRWGTEWPDGTWAGFSCLPFITRELWDGAVQPMMTAQYFGDNWVTFRSGKAGYAPYVVRGYLFKHHWAQHKRGAGMGYQERLRHDERVFREAMGMANRNEWTQPWPPRESA